MNEFVLPAISGGFALLGVFWMIRMMLVGGREPRHDDLRGRYSTQAGAALMPAAIASVVDGKFIAVVWFVIAVNLIIVGRQFRERAKRFRAEQQQVVADQEAAARQLHTERLAETDRLAAEFGMSPTPRLPEPEGR